MKKNYTIKQHEKSLKNLELIIFVLLFVFNPIQLFTQTNCGPTTPTFTVNLTGNPNGTWISPVVVRDDTCCGTSAPDKCIQFIITLDPAAQGISFNIYSGAVPPGAMYYQINCGAPVAVGSPICLNGVGPHYLTFCKPGNNSNQYSITSLMAPGTAGDTMAMGCTGGMLSAWGYYEPSITWTSIYPGPQGAYNSYLSCISGCDTVIVTPQPTSPSYIDYQICGLNASLCDTVLICDTVRIYIFSTLQVTITGNTILCSGSSSGFLTANPSGGDPPYSYQWSNGNTTQTIAGLSSGNYSVTIVDANGCTISGSTTIIQPAPLAVLSAQTNVSCYGGNNALASVAVSGGNIPYSYSWNNGQTISVINNISAGNYSVTVTDANGCTITAFFSITQPSVLMVTKNSSPETCAQANGSASVNVFGGTPPYTYQWMPCGCTSNAIAALAAGTYTAIVADANGCSSIDTFIISGTVPPNLTTSASPVSCFAGSNGNASVTASGAQTPYTYYWSNGNTNANATGLSAGNYWVTVISANGCSSSASILISQPTQMSVSVSQNDASCFGMSNGSASVSPSGGTPPYFYQWNNGQTTQSVSGLAAGNYFVTTTDNNGCTNVQNIFIGQPTQVVLSIFSLTNVSCYGGSNGTATAVTYGGVAPYTYMWNNGQTSVIATGLSAGNYIVTVLDNNGCTMMTSVNINEPSALSSSMNSANVKCFGGNNGIAAVTVSGGTSPYYYSWNNGATTSQISNLTSQSYSVIITDANGCTQTNTVLITQPALLTASINNVQNVSCFLGSNGSASANVNGGTLPYTYLWNNGQTTQTAAGLPAGNYSVTITDANGCTAVNIVSITQPNAILVTITPDDTICPNQNTTITANASGGTPPFTYLWQPNNAFGNSQTVNPNTNTTYTAIITDANGCTATNTTTLYIYNMNMAVSMNASPSICVGQTATLSAAATGNNIGSYYWSNNLGNGTGPYAVSPNTTTTYSVTVTNICGATATAAATIVVHPLPQINIPPQNGVSCDIVTLQFSDTNSANNGSTYIWNFGDGNSSTQANPSHNYMQSGNYMVNVTVTSQYGCSSTSQVNCSVIVFPSPDADFTSNPSLETSIINPDFRFFDQSSNTTIWSWDFGDGTYSSLQNPNHTYAETGIYTVKLITQNNDGCIDSIIKTVEVKPEFTFYIPNTFTPNGDHLNDVFSGKGIEITEFEMLIFDRWGNQIFKTNDLNTGWDGRANEGVEIAQQDVYVYKIKLRDFEKREHNYAGQVNLIK